MHAEPQGPLRQLACRGLRVALRARTRPLQITDAPALVVAPHPDDEVLGCGGAILMKRRAGARVTVAYVTDGDRSHPELVAPREMAARRRAEAQRACARLDAEPRFLGLPDGGVAARVHDAALALAELITELAPREVFAPAAFDHHADHVAVSEATARALGTRVGPPRDLYLYSVYQWRRWPWCGDGELAFDASIAQFSHHLDVAGVALDKRDALAAHASQLVRPPGMPFSYWTLGEWAGGEFLTASLTGDELFVASRV